jgi:hypothetical protein
MLKFGVVTVKKSSFVNTVSDNITSTVFAIAVTLKHR